MEALDVDIETVRSTYEEDEEGRSMAIYVRTIDSPDREEWIVIPTQSVGSSIERRIFELELRIVPQMVAVSLGDFTLEPNENWLEQGVEEDAVIFWGVEDLGAITAGMGAYHSGNNRMAAQAFHEGHENGCVMCTAWLIRMRQTPEGWPPLGTGGKNFEDYFSADGNMKILENNLLELTEAGRGEVLNQPYLFINLSTYTYTEPCALLLT